MGERGGRERVGGGRQGGRGRESCLRTGNGAA